MPPKPYLIPLHAGKVSKPWTGRKVRGAAARQPQLVSAGKEILCWVQTSPLGTTQKGSVQTIHRGQDLNGGKMKAKKRREMVTANKPRSCSQEEGWGLRRLGSAHGKGRWAARSDSCHRWAKKTAACTGQGTDPRRRGVRSQVEHCPPRKPNSKKRLRITGWRPQAEPREVTVESLLETEQLHVNRLNETFTSRKIEVSFSIPSTKYN